MRTLSYIIAPQDAGRTVQDYLRREQGYSSRTLVGLKHIPDGLTRNGVHVRTIDRLGAGDLLTVCMRDAESGLAQSEREVPLLFADEDVIVYNKPSAMPCHPSNGHYDDTLANVYAAYWAKRGRSPAFRALNRLDTDTTGCVLVATSQYTASLLTARLKKAMSPSSVACRPIRAARWTPRSCGGISSICGISPAWFIPMASARSHTMRCLPRAAVIAWPALCSKPAVPIRSGCTWHIWGIRWRGTPCMAGTAPA